MRAYADDDRVGLGEDANHSDGLAFGIMKIIEKWLCLLGFRA